MYKKRIPGDNDYRKNYYINLRGVKGGYKMRRYILRRFKTCCRFRAGRNKASAHHTE